MAIFFYKAKKGPKEIVEGTVEAENRDGAILKIGNMGYVAVQVDLSKNGQKKESALRFGLFNRVRPKDLTVFTYQLATLVKAKVTLFEAINILSAQTENASLKSIIAYISSELKDGKTLSEAMRKYPKVFPPLYINMIHSGELGGVLEETLIRLSRFREEEEDTKAKISSALAYPIFIIIVGIVTVFLLLTFAIPRLVSLFSDMGQTLPLPTRILILISNGVRNYWWGFLVVGIFATLIFKRKKAVKKEKIFFDRIKLKIPIVGNFIKKAMLASFARTFGTLVVNSIPVFQAMEMIIPTINNEVFKKELEKVYEGIIDGLPFAKSMGNSEWFPPFMINMVVVAEKGGNLYEALIEIANFYEREVNKMMKTMTSLLEPIIISVMGLIIGFIVMAMLLPIFQVNLG
ncbi:MAG: type II secretion system F family protein [Candidatus Susulua stagnicola]|nr:type II secretion system F family protein [Candidatus Susulua stagnicola]